MIGAFLFYYAIGLPLGIVLAFKMDMGITGLILGSVVGLGSVGCYFYYILRYKLNWYESIVEFEKR